MILEKVRCPSDVKKLGAEDLRKLAGELRETIIRTVRARPWWRPPP